MKINAALMVAAGTASAVLAYFIIREILRRENREPRRNVLLVGGVRA